MTKKNYLIIDIGASNGRVIVGSFDGLKIKMNIVHRFLNKPVYLDKILYWDLLRLNSEIIKGILIAESKYEEIESLAIDTWGGDFGFIDRNMRIISNPVHYRDQNRYSVVDKLYRILPRKRIYNLTGAIPVESSSLFHLYYLKVKKFIEIEHGYKILMIPDIFNLFLTGTVLNEYTSFTLSFLFNQKKGKIENKIIKKLGIPKKLPADIIKPGIIIGKLGKSFCNNLDISSIPVASSASHDTASAVIGVPSVNKNINWAFVSIGTWCVLGVETDYPIISDDAFNLGYENAGNAEGTYLINKNLNGLWTLQQCFNKWKATAKNLSWKKIETISKSAKPFKTFIDTEDPNFFKTQTDMPSVICKYCKDFNNRNLSDINEVSRCLYESLVMRLKLEFISLEKLIKNEFSVIFVIGGGIRNKVLCQWISNATGISVITGSAESTSIGNLIMQLKAKGEISNLYEGRKICKDSIDMFFYDPKETEQWNFAYQRYLKIIGNSDKGNRY